MTRGKGWSREKEEKNTRLCMLKVKKHSHYLRVSLQNRQQYRLRQSHSAGSGSG